MAACISARFEVSGSCKNTSGMSSKVMKLMRNFGLVPQRREGKEGRAGRKGEREGGEGVRKNKLKRVVYSYKLTWNRSLQAFVQK